MDALKKEAEVLVQEAELVAMRKQHEVTGVWETIKVHASAVEAHLAAFWKKVTD